MVSSRGWRPDRLPILAGLPLFIMAGSASSAASGVRCTRRLGSGWGRKPSSPTADLSALIGDGSSSHQRPPGAVPPVSKAGHQLRGEMLEETGPDGAAGADPEIFYGESSQARGATAAADKHAAASWLDGDDTLVALGTASRSQLVLRACFLALVFLFPILTAGLAYLSSWFRDKVWYGALTHSIALCGTAFIKWGQWSSTRPDMFPEELCKRLSVLHKGAPSHRYAYTKKLVERAYDGRPINEVFDWFEKKPMASGSIAQVHKAVLRGEVVAVKVRHPKVKQRIFMDFVIMSKIASFADKRPSLKWMNLGPSMEQFSHTMAAQTDLALEARHLNQFNENFKANGWNDCRFPKVIYCVEDVLVETFEEGCVVSDYAKMFEKRALDGNPGILDWLSSKLSGRSRREFEKMPEPDAHLGHFIVTRGEDMWLKMVLNDGLLHADLHPGNILVHVPEDGTSPPHLVLVDAGMVAKLYGYQRRHFIRLLECLGAGDGIGAAQAVLQFSSEQTCVSEEEREAFMREMEAVFRERCRGYHTNVDVGDILRGVLTCVRKHSVRVDVEYATLILNILCLDSIGKLLLPTYNILDGAEALLEAHKVGQRLVGGIGVKAALPLARALKARQDRRFLRKLIRDTEDNERRVEALLRQEHTGAMVVDEPPMNDDDNDRGLIASSTGAVVLEAVDAQDAWRRVPEEPPEMLRILDSAAEGEMREPSRPTAGVVKVASGELDERVESDRADGLRRDFGGAGYLDIPGEPVVGDAAAPDSGMDDGFSGQAEAAEAVS